MRFLRLDRISWYDLAFDCTSSHLKISQLWIIYSDRFSNLYIFHKSIKFTLNLIPITIIVEGFRSMTITPTLDNKAMLMLFNQIKLSIPNALDLIGLDGEIGSKVKGAYCGPKRYFASGSMCCIWRKKLSLSTSSKVPNIISSEMVLVFWKKNICCKEDDRAGTKNYCLLLASFVDEK